MPAQRSLFFACKNSCLYFQSFNGDDLKCKWEFCREFKEEHYLVDGTYYCPVCCVSGNLVPTQLSLLLVLYGWNADSIRLNLSTIDRE